MSEAKIEKQIKRHIESTGGLCIKMHLPFFTGFPDRLVIIKGRVLFLEIKTLTGRTSKRQDWVIKRLKALDQEVHVVRSLDQLIDILNEKRVYKKDDIL